MILPESARGVRKMISIWNKNEAVSGRLAGKDYYPIGPNSKIHRIEVDARKYYKWYEGIKVHSFENNHMKEFIEQAKKIRKVKP